jgi:orotidine-5'-phosphate decarboxylase
MIMANEKVFVALDNMGLDEIFEFLDSAQGRIKNIKIGLELFNKYGPGVVKEIYEKYGLNIFLDLKLHDIPNTVSKAVLSLKGLPIKFLTVHLSGGSKMLEETIKARDLSIPDCKILGVSVLTSLDEKDLKEIWNIESLESALENLFKIAKQTNIDGVICSPKDLSILKELNSGLLAVTPGIRFIDEIANNTISDQKRVLPPKDAFENGADYLVMGRSLTQANDLNQRIEQLEKLPTS